MFVKGTTSSAGATKDMVLAELAAGRATTVEDVNCGQIKAAR